jgi:[calcium/calmodulin-dependent protein kinase] kinase
MDHENIVKLFEVIDDPDNDKLYLVMELVKKGALGSKTYWKCENIDISEDSSTPLVPLEKLRKYARDFLKGLNYLHNYAKIFHRDIKPDNLLIDEFDTLKIADFGVSSLKNDSEEI